MHNRALTFPGQGSQAVGMGVELAAAYPQARRVFEEVDEALGEKLTALMAQGPTETLQLTENAQPALMAVSLAVVRVLESEGLGVPDIADYVAGHSLGEYSALCAAGSIEIGATARLLKTRGRAMQEAVPVGRGGMAALLGFDIKSAAEITEAVRQGEVCEVANDNAPGQVVISGHIAAVERAVEMARAANVGRAVMLAVSAPFHCSLMAPAAEAMEEALAAVDILPPAVPLVANVLTTPISDPAEIRRRLVEQVTERVRWRVSVIWMADQGGVSEFAELGAGNVLTRLSRRIVEGPTAISIGKPEEIEAFLRDHAQGAELKRAAAGDV